VGVLDRAGDAEQQQQLLAQGRLTPRAPAVQGLAVDVFHHAIQQAVRGGAAVQQPDHVRVAQPRQHLPLGLEALAKVSTRQAGFEDLDGDRLPVVIDAHGPVDVPHAAARHVLLHLVRAQAPPDQLSLTRGCGQPGLHAEGARRAQERLPQRQRVVAEELGHLGGQGLVVGAGPLEVLPAFTGRTAPGLLEGGPDLPPPFGRHLLVPPDLPMQPGPGEPEVAFHRADGNAELRGDLGDA
jgi:hypothetical protein